MFTAPMIGLLAALSASVWVYSKIMRRTGGNTKNALVVAAIAGLFAFILVVTIVSMVDNSLAK